MTEERSRLGAFSKGRSSRPAALSATTAKHASQLRDALVKATVGLVEREVLADLISLAAVAGEHVLIIGPPGTAKSEVVRRVARVFGGTSFEYLLGRFTEPSEIFGPIDIKKLRDGVIEAKTTGMLPEADVAFLDEVFLGSTAILNTLLGILNERVFRRGQSVIRCPLRVCVGASNALPEEPALAAFADRFLLRSFVEPIPDPRLEELLSGGASVGAVEDVPALGLTVIDELHAAAVQLDVGPVRAHIAHAVRTLRAQGVSLSDRRIVKLQRLVAAAAVLAGRRDQPTPADLWPIIYAVPTADEQAAARDALADQLAQAENDALRAAAADASRGPKARAALLVETGEALLSEEASTEVDVELRLEGVLRDIDAGFSPSMRTEELAALRERLIAKLSDGAEDAPTTAPSPTSMSQRGGASDGDAGGGGGST